MPPRVAPSPLTPPSRQRRSSRSSDPRRLSGVQARRSSAEWLFQFDPRTALDPHSPFLEAWHQVLLIVLVFQSFLLPYAVIYVPPTPHGGADASTLPPLLKRPEFLAFYGAEVLFLADFYFKLNTGFYEDGNIYRDASRSRVKYLLSAGFVLDAIAIVPFALIVKQSAISTTPVVLECHKFLRIWRVPQYFVILEDAFAKYFVTIKMLKVVVVTAFVTHVLACARVSFGVRTMTDDEQLWLPSADHNSSMYLRSFFWTFGLLTGVYEGELPRASSEFAFSIVVLLAGFSLFSYLCAVFFVLSKSEQTRGTAAEAKLNQLKHVLCYYHVPEHLQVQAVEYITRYHTDAESNDREVVQLLCPSITRDLQVELLRETVATVPLFKACNSAFITALTTLLEMISLPADFQLFETGDPGDCMYVVSSGTLHILVGGIKVRELCSGSFFGEVSVFSNRPRSATVVTASYCTLYKLSRFHIERVLEGYPQYAESITHAVNAILSQHPTSTADPTAQGVHQEVFLLTTLFQESKEIKNGSSAPLSTSHTYPTDSLVGKRRLTHKRSLHSSTEETRDVKIKKAPSTKKPQIGRSKSALDVSIARRDQLSLISRRSEREKTERGNTEAPDVQGVGPTNDQIEAAIEQSPTFVPRPTLFKRSQSFFSKRSGDSNPLQILPSLRSSLAADTMRAFYDNLSKLLNQKRQHRNPQFQWLAKVLLRKPLPRASLWRCRWLMALQCVLLFHWIIIPALLGFDLLRTHLATAWGFQFVAVVIDLLLWADIYGSANLELLVPTYDDQERELDTTQLAARYIRSKAFVADLVCVLPYPLIGFCSGSITWTVVLSIPRLGRVWRLREHWREWHACHVSEPAIETPSLTLSSSQPPTKPWTQTQQVVAMSVLFFIGLHVVACTYFSLTHFEGFAHASYESAWLPTPKFDPSNNPRAVSVGSFVANQYARALFFAATTLTTLGETVEPKSDLQIVFAVVCMAFGLVLSALLVDIVHTRFTAATVEQKNFLVMRAQIQSFLRSQRAPADILQRVNAFLDFWWSSHRGAVASELLRELPDTIKREILGAMCQPAMQTLSLLADVQPVLAELQKVFVGSVDFILYGQGEIIYRQGDYASGLFFLLEGEVCMTTNGSAPRSIPKGGFFGTASLHLSESSVSYAERMTAISGCIVLYVSREHLHAMHKTFPSLSMALKALEKRVIDSKLVRNHALESRRGSATVSMADRRVLVAATQRFPRLHALLATLFQVDNEDGEIVFDPDSPTYEIWQLWIAVLIVFESFKVIYEVCFGVYTERIWLSEIVAVLCEACFAVDMFIHGRLGFYKYGNKIMDRVQIQRRYYRSSCFVAELVAILPLYTINWFITVARSRHSRIELLSINKVTRLVRVNTTLTVVEVQYLNRALELRLLKIVYYTALLAHTLGCVWFSFGISSTTGSSWVPDANLQNATASVQYLSAIFWSFGVMTASTSSAVPHTPLQSLFAVLTMLSGLALFAYVVGNLADVTELRGADTREFNSQLASLRHLLAHFALPENLQDRLKTYVFFQRSHLITQEHVLESYLPPSLLTDIRLVHLQPMIIKVAFLSGMESSVTRMLVSQFQQVIVVKNQHICRYGDQGSDMFFVFTGVVDVLVPAATLHRLSSETAATGGSIAAAACSNFRGIGEPKQATTSAPQSYVPPQGSSSSLLGLTAMKKVNELTPGDYFGEIALFTSKPRTANTLARTSCVLYKLSRRSLELVFERYPAWKKGVLKIVKIQQEQQHLRNLYTAEQQYDENRMRQMQEQVQQATSDSVSSPISPRRLGEKIANSSKQLARRLALKEDEAASPQPVTFGLATNRIAPLTATPSTRSISPNGSATSSKPTPAATGGLAPQLSATPSVMSANAQKKALQAKKKPPSPSELWIDKLLECTEVQSPTHVLWLRVVAVATLFMAVAMPFQVAFDIHCYADSSGKLIHIILPMATRALSHVCELIFAWDIWMNWNMKESFSSMELYETRHREAYQTQQRLLWDALAAFPFDHFIADFYQSPWLRLNRCLKVVNFRFYVDEIYKRSVRYEQTRFVSRWLLFLTGMYWCSCAYFVVAQLTTAKPSDSWYQWAPPAVCLLDTQHIAAAMHEGHQHTGEVLTPVQQLGMRLERSFFFAVTVFVKKGKTFVPASETQLLFTIAISFVGMLSMAIMIGEVAHLYVSYISNEVDFRHHQIALREYLQRWRIKRRLRDRAHAFLSSLWSSRRGVDYQAILEDIPLEIRNDVVLHVGRGPLEGFVSQCFVPLLSTSPSSKTELEALMQAIAQQLTYECFPRDETVIIEGSIAKEMFFVVKGVLILRSSAESAIATALASPPMGLDDSISMIPREVRLVAGDFFGEKGLLGYAVSRCAVRTMRACDLLSLSSEALLGVLLSRSVFQTALGIAVESYREMMQFLRVKCAHLDADALDAAALMGLSTPDEPWGDILLAVLEKRQRTWQDQWQVGELSAAQYNMLGPMRDVKHPEACRRLFDNLLRLILPGGSLFARVASVRNKPKDTSQHDGSTPGDKMTSAADFHESLPVMMSERGGWNWSGLSTVSSSGSRDLSFSRRVQSRTRLSTQSLTAKMLPQPET
jgi:CRP-like cAMP-binding protein